MCPFRALDMHFNVLYFPDCANAENKNIIDIWKAQSLRRPKHTKQNIIRARMVPIIRESKILKTRAMTSIKLGQKYDI